MTKPTDHERASKLTVLDALAKIAKILAPLSDEEQGKVIAALGQCK